MEQIEFPFRLTNILFTKLEFKRRPQVPENHQLSLRVHTRLHSEGLPEQLQIDLQIETEEEQPICFAIELIGLFELAQEEPKPDFELARRFLNERAFYMLFALARQKIGEITYTMGVQPIQIPMPFSAHFPLEESNAEEEDVVNI